MKTEQVERAVRGLIEAGQLGSGGRLPSERSLAQDLSAGRTTVLLVLMKLAAEGMIRSEHGLRSTLSYAVMTGRQPVAEADSQIPEPWQVHGECVDSRRRPGPGRVKYFLGELPNFASQGADQVC